MAAEGSPARSPALQQRLADRDRPLTSVVGHQRWKDLLFAHWKVPAADVQATLPRGLFVDRFAGDAYLGIVPFFMKQVRPRWLPALPWISWFLELNVRTYVHDEHGRPGVWFYSLDCNQPLAVAIARRCFRLPYQHARMSAHLLAARWHYDCQRLGEAAAWHFAWKPPASGTEAAPGTLEFFLLERYTLFAADRAGRLFSGRVHHAPYRITPVPSAECATGPAKLAGFDLEGPPTSLLASPGVNVAVFAIRPLTT